MQGYLEPATTATAGRTFATDGGSSRMLDTTVSGVPMTNRRQRGIDVYAGRTDAGSGLPREGLRGVWLTLTIAGVSGSGYVTAAPGNQPTAVSNVNFVATESRTNSVFVAVPSSTDGSVCIKVSTASAHVVVDVLAMTTA